MQLPQVPLTARFNSGRGENESESDDVRGSGSGSGCGERESGIGSVWSKENASKLTVVDDGHIHVPQLNADFLKQTNVKEHTNTSLFCD